MAPEPAVSELLITVVRVSDGAARTSVRGLGEDAEGRLLVEGDGCGNAYLYSHCGFIPAPHQFCRGPTSDYAVSLEFGAAIPPAEYDMEDGGSDTVCPWDGACISASIDRF